MQEMSIYQYLNKFPNDTNLGEHMVEYHQEMSVTNILNETHEAITCKTFGRSLGTLALTQI